MQPSLRCRVQGILGFPSRTPTLKLGLWTKTNTAPSCPFGASHPVSPSGWPLIPTYMSLLNSVAQFSLPGLS